MSEKQLVMYSRTYGCPFVNIAKKVLNAYDVDYVEIFIDHNEEDRQRVVEWTGFESVPTLVVANKGDLLPAEEPSPLAEGRSPRGIDRGSMLTEPSGPQLKQWLERHELLKPLSQ